MHIHILTPNFVPIWNVCIQVTTVAIYAKSCLGMSFLPKSGRLRALVSIGYELIPKTSFWFWEWGSRSTPNKSNWTILISAYGIRERSFFIQSQLPWRLILVNVWLVFDLQKYVNLLCVFLEVNPCFRKAHIFCMDLQPVADTIIQCMLFVRVTFFVSKLKSLALTCAWLRWASGLTNYYFIIQQPYNNTTCEFYLVYCNFDQLSLLTTQPYS